MSQANPLSGTGLQIRRLIFGLALLAACFKPATSPADEPKENKANGEQKDVLKAELEKLRGTWVVKSLLVDGKLIPGSCKYTFSKSTCTMEWEPCPIILGQPVLAFEFELDATSSPRAMYQLDPGTKKNDWRAIAQIYRFRDEKLEICHSVHRERWGKPPAKFDGSAGSGQMLITLKRLETEKPKPK